MMLHEAVMLEIYRQALNASELASPRCQSRESIVSIAAGDGRCPSNESHCSGNDSATPTATPTPISPPVGLPLPATLAPTAAAALLPPQSAAMAAYLNAAAAAAQQNHLLLTNPLAAAASLVQQATQSHSPNSGTLLAAHALSSPSASDMPDASALDFSTKRVKRELGNGGSDEDETDDARNNNDLDNRCGSGGDMLLEDANSPLDLSVNAGRKRQSSDEELLPASHKISRINDFKPVSTDTWVPPMNPYLAAVAAATLSPKNPLTLDWNTKQKIAPNEATKALEKMTEMTRLGSSTDKEMGSCMRQVPATHAPNANPSASNGRHSAWQSHWLNKGADAVKDVFKCVWCKQSFPTLATLTTHMKETQHCGVNVPPAVSAGAVGMPPNSNGNHAAPSAQHSRHSSAHRATNNSSPASNSSSAAAAAAANAITSNKSDLNLLIKETMPLPRKLVRGQDVWLGKGAEQTRQILKCMWCGQSFRSLAEMTSHMQETQHYTNIISQEQIISWKSSDDKSSSGGSSNGAMTSPAVTSPSASAATTTCTQSPNVSTSNATVSAVLTCKVCDQAFSSLKELSNHMVKNAHYKEHMLRTTADSNPVVPRRGRQTREKRKKSLPVRKLLELERAQQDFKSNSLEPALKPLRDFTAATKITCEKCGDKVETAVFVDHIRLCLGGSILMSPRSHHNNNNNNHSLKPPYAMPMGPDRLTSPQSHATNRDERKTAELSSISPASSSRPDILYAIPKDGEKNSSAPSVLNAIEQLIEKSFDTRPRQGALSGGGGGQMTTPLGSSILKRLGIDDTVDYTKPLMDPQTMQFLRSYSGFSGRDRSASESSSVSERCSSRLESVTPERNSRQTTPRLTPEKMLPGNEAATWHKEFLDTSFKVKSEPTESSELREHAQKISVKKEFSMTDADDEMPLKKIGAATTTDADIKRHSRTPGSRAISPSVSEGSITPTSNCSLGEKKKSQPAGSSLNALSSMFDNLNSMTAAAHNIGSNLTISTETNNNTTVTQKKSKSNPLAALQKLCDTTDPPAANARNNNDSATNNLSVHAASTNNHVAATTGSNTGSMVTFSWACNDALMTAADSIIKCSYCDTPFCSKGAYRHHLSKVHFVKDDADSQSSSNAMKSPGLAASPKSIASPKSASKSPLALHHATSPSSMPTISPYDESAQSKFLKYTELAKQLSSKNV